MKIAKIFETVWIFSRNIRKISLWNIPKIFLIPKRTFSRIFLGSDISTTKFNRKIDFSPLKKSITGQKKYLFPPTKIRHNFYNPSVFFPSMPWKKGVKWSRKNRRKHLKNLINFFENETSICGNFSASQWNGWGGGGETPVEKIF